MSAHDRPSPVELLEAVRAYLDAPPDPGRDPLHRRVASNVVALVERELRSGPDDDAAHARRLAALGVADDTELAALAGGIDEDHPLHATLVRELVAWAEAKVRVVNPRYLEAP